MRSAPIQLSICLLAAFGCSAVPPPEAPTPPPGRSAPEAAREPPPPGGPTIAETRRAIELALSRPADREALVLFTECRRDGGLESIEIYGDGVGVWGGKRQFAVAPRQITAILEAFVGSGFAAMPVQFGGKGGPVAPPLPGDEGGVYATAVLCRVALSYAGIVKEVVQLEKGEQSEALRELSDAFFRECAEASRAGVEAADLADGLDKVAHGELAPQTLRLMLHYRPQPSDGESLRGFRLTLHGRDATSRVVHPGRGFGEQRSARLSADELEQLARELAAQAPATLPPNLWAEIYTDFSLEVLDRKVSVQARQFSGLEPTTHGEAQRRFESIFELLSELEARVAGGS